MMKVSEEIKAEAKEQLQEKLGEFVTAIEIVTELADEEGEEFVETLKPLLNIYKRIIQITSEEITDMSVDNIVAAVNKLEDNGFTRSQAIELLKR